MHIFKTNKLKIYGKNIQIFTQYNLMKYLVIIIIIIYTEFHITP